MTSVPQVALAAQPGGMRFVGTERVLLRLLLRATALMIPTFGFYRFWLATQMRRHLWANTAIGDDTFEYTGTGRELLIGFLVAMAIVVPLNIAYFILALEAERLVAFASVPFFLLVYVFGHYAYYRARRYRATRTVLRGVRFWMTGSGGAYLWRALAWDIATLLTLGIAYPWRQAALARYTMRHTRYGTIEASFAGRGMALFRRAGWLWLIWLALAGGLVFFALREDWMQVGVIAAPLMLVAAVALFPYLQAAELRWWLDGIRFGPVAVASDLRAWAVYRCYIRQIGYSLVYTIAGSLTLGIVVGGVFFILHRAFGVDVPLGAIAGSGEDGVLVRIGGSVAASVLVIGFLLGFGIITRLCLDRGLWAAAARSVTLTNLAALDDVAAGAGAIPGGVGEGLLDALDLGGGF